LNGGELNGGLYLAQPKSSVDISTLSRPAVAITMGVALGTVIAPATLSMHLLRCDNNYRARQFIKDALAITALVGISTRCRNSD
jgi:hypothetical protein